MPPKHPDLYPTHLRLLNLSQPIFLHNSDICTEAEIALVTIVHSAIEHQVGTWEIFPVNQGIVSHMVCEIQDIPDIK